MGASLFPPLPPDALVFTPSPPEFLPIAEELLGPLEADYQQVDQQSEAMVTAFGASTQQLVALDPDLDDADATHGEVKEPIELAPLLELLAAVQAGEPDLHELVDVAGLLPDQGVGEQPPPPGAGDPTIPPAPSPPGGGGEENPSTCVELNATNCNTGLCGGLCICASDSGVTIMPVEEGGSCG